MNKLKVFAYINKLKVILSSLNGILINFLFTELWLDGMLDNTKYILDQPSSMRHTLKKKTLLSLWISISKPYTTLISTDI